MPKAVFGHGVGTAEKFRKLMSIGHLPIKCKMGTKKSGGIELEIW